ncbi:MAG: TonB-dependent receptor [Bacteroidales bacterium]|nr:TonB-dependent receptor [Bacteroidales bacterium]
MKNSIKFWRFVLLLFFTMFSLDLLAQVTMSGIVTDESGNTLPGVNVFEKGTTNGTITDLDGKYMINVRNGAVISFSFMGYDEQEFTVSNTKSINVVLKESTQEIEEVVVVGYGQQKKASVVGAITQATNEQLQRAAGVPDLGQALTGNLPGLVTMQSTGMPGEENPDIVIRGSSSWNSSAPLVLVDGIERPMNSVDVSSVASISVLKDASATAIYGVKGANGVIIITTKRGSEGRAQINVSFSTTMKTVSKLPGKLDAYDALMARNMAIENELNLSPVSWDKVETQEFINNYRNQDPNKRDEKGNLLIERYPNIDWQDYLFKSHAMAYNANVNIAGGSKFVRYYSSIDWANESDLFKRFENNRGYHSGYAYNRVNVRSNLDFNITKTTVLKTNLSGSVGMQNTPWNNNGYSNLGEWALSQQWAGVYGIPSNAYYPQYEDGSWGNYDVFGIKNVSNGAQTMAYGGGTNRTTTTNIATDIILEQDLKFITDGLSLTGMISWDNRFTEKERGIYDLYNDPLVKNIDPHTGEAYYQPTDGYDKVNRYDFSDPVDWGTNGGNVNHWTSPAYKNLNYQIRVNWDRSFDKHNITAMGLFERQEQTNGSEIPRLRENWCFRVTYNWNNRYFLEYNGAYNGSEKFSDDNRFAFFNSGALGWTISNESFMDNLRESGIIENFKLRASYGEIGDDSYGAWDNSKRWLYVSTWGTGGSSFMNEMHGGWGGNENKSPYTYYYEGTVGNSDVHWEVVRKFNFGFDYSFLKGMFRGSFDIFRDHRTDILIGGGDRAVPSYFGMSAPTANLGEVKTKGYEMELKFNKDLEAVKGLNVWANFNMSHAENKVIEREDREIYPNYRKQAGYAIGQTRSQLSNGFMQTYDDIYASPQFDVQDNYKLPGDYYYVDFNGDGIINSDDSAPIYYSNVPQNTYNATLGVNYKGWGAFVQFYGVNNVTRDVSLTSFGLDHLDNVYDTGTWWAADHDNADVVTPRYLTSDANHNGTQFLYDGSYIRLKNAEISYTFNTLKVGKYKFNNVKIYLNGNNLWVHTKMPDDRESNLSGVGYQGQYPTVKRFTLGLKFSL